MEPPSPLALLSRAARFMRRNLFRILLVGALTSTVTFAVLFLFMRQYAATAILMIDPRAARVTEKAGVLANIGSDFNAIESIVQIAKSEGFIGSVVDRLELTHSPVFAGNGETEQQLRQSTIEKLAARMSVARRGTTYVIDIVVRSPSAEESARVANGAAQQILEDQSGLRSGTSATAAREIEGRLNELRGRVNRAEQAVAEFRAAAKVTDAGQGSTLIERRLSELNQQMVLAATRTAEARARLEALRSAGANGGANLFQDSQSSVFSSLRAEYARLLRQAADQRTVLGPRHPEAISLAAQIADLRGQITREIERMVSSARSNLTESESREAELTRQLKAAQTESGELGRQLVKLGELEREAKAERSVYEELLQRQRQLAQVNGLEPSDVRIVSSATAPAKPATGRILLFVASLAVGAFAGLGYAAVMELRRRTLKTRSQAERLGGVEGMGFLPAVDAGRHAVAEVPNLMPWLSQLCAELSLRSENRGGYVLNVSSACKGEGRSTVAINIAAYLSKRGERVLLIEADKPSHLRKAPHGLIDILASGQNLKSGFIEQRSDGYTLLPYGGRESTSANMIGALMSSVTLRAILKLARNWFDVIVIDGPPALDAPHARFLSAQADGTVFLIEWDKTDVSDAEAALDRLETNETVIVFNKTDTERLRHYDPVQAREIESVGVAA